MKTETLAELAPLPWRVVYDSSAGYDCMTGAFTVIASNGKHVASLDLNEYGQKNCGDDGEARVKAQAVAERITLAVNALPQLVAALREYVIRSRFDNPQLQARQDRALAAIKSATQS